jgi:hypothetical protein
MKKYWQKGDGGITKEFHIFAKNMRGKAGVLR